jgi:autotransporter-associated beta strand protein
MTRTAFFSTSLVVTILSAGIARGQLDPNAFTSLGTLNVSSGTLTINTDTLAMSGAATVTGVALNQSSGPAVAVFDFSSITIGSGVTVNIVGTRPIALLSQGNAVVQAGLSGTGGYLGGGLVLGGSGNSGFGGQGPGAGGGIGNQVGGGGFGGAGGAAGSAFGGGTYGNLFQTLQGGSGGGGCVSAGTSGGFANGGNGGGAIEIATVGTLSVSGAINASGSVGSGTTNSAGGGGAGGGIMLSGRGGLTISSTLTANGGAAYGSLFAGGGGGGRIALAGLSSYTFTQMPTGLNLNGGNNAGNGSPGLGGVITLDPLITDIPNSFSVVLNGSPIVAVAGSATQNSPTVETYIRHHLLVFDGGTATLGINNALQQLDSSGNNITDLDVEGTFNLNGFSQAVDTLDNGTLFPGTVNLPAGSTLTVGTANDSSTFTGQFTGTGNLVKVGTGTQTLGGTFNTVGSPNFTGSTTVAGGILSIAHNLELEFSTVTLAGGTLSFSVLDPVLGALAGASNQSLTGLNSFTVGGNNGSTTYSGNLSGSVAGGLIKSGTGTWTLTGTNTQSGPFNIMAGTALVGSAGALSPSAPITVSAGATLDLNGYGYVVTSANPLAVQGSLRLGGASVTVASGATATYSGSLVSNGFLRGPGTHVVTGGATLSGVTAFNSTVINETGAGQFQNFSNGGALTVAGGVTGAVFNGFSNEGSGSVTMGALSAAGASDFQTYGVLTINPAMVTQDFSQTTLLTNTGTSPLNFNGGSRTFVGTPATAVFPSNWPNVSQRGFPTFVAGIDLHGQNAIVAGGLFVNNGYVEDSTNNFQGTATIVADFGSLVKGAGYFQNTVQTVNGGKFQAGNSPGKASFGSFVLGPGGVNNYVFAIDDATGTAGPSPDAAGHVSGWGLVKAINQAFDGSASSGKFTWTATPTDKLTVSLQTLVNPTTVGDDVLGPMSDFDPTKAYLWPAVEWAGNYTGPPDVAYLDASTAFDTSGVVNPVAGTFGWALDTADNTLSLTYTPSAVPEPSALVLSGIAAIAAVFRPRRRQPRLGHRP